MVARYIIKKVMKSSLKKKRVNTPTLEKTMKHYKRVLEGNKRAIPADTHVSAGSKGPIPLDKQSKIQSSLSGTEFFLPLNKNIKGVKFVNDKTLTQTFQDNVKDLIGIDDISNKMQQRKMFKTKKKMLGGLLTAGAKEAAKRYFKSGGRKTTTIMKMFGGTRSEAKTDVLSGLKMNTSDQYTKNLFDKSMQRIIDLGRKK